MTTIVLATNNAHKVTELQALLRDAGLDVSCVAMRDVCGPVEIDETGATFEENAYIKAITIHRLTGLPVVADDSGLEVDVLDGAPGVRSARYAGPDATDERNRVALRHALSDHAADTSSARFRCVLCYVDAYRTLFGVGSCEGAIISEERGANGFGYDPMFVPHGHTRTFGEMDASEKASMSHRGAATSDLARHLRALLRDTGHATIDDALPRPDALIMASVYAVIGNDAMLRSTIRHFVRDDEDALVLHEALLQSYLFAGFPVALEALAIVDEECRDILGEQRWPEAEAYNVELFRRRGEELCRRVYGSVYERMMDRLGAITPDLSSWMIVEGYGKTLSRPALDIIERELCIVGMLAALGRENQLRSHVRGAFLVGATADHLHACADVVVESCGRMAGDAILRNILLQEGSLANDGR